MPRGYEELGAALESFYQVSVCCFVLSLSKMILKQHTNTTARALGSFWSRINPRVIKDQSKSDPWSFLDPWSRILGCGPWQFLENIVLMLPPLHFLCTSCWCRWQVDRTSPSFRAVNVKLYWQAVDRITWLLFSLC
jgi:hypothetical protein